MLYFFGGTVIVYPKHFVGHAKERSDAAIS